MTNGKQTTRQLHIATQSGRALCGVPGAATTSDRHTTTCGRCRKIAKISHVLIKATQPDPPEPVHEPMDALELVERLKASFAKQMTENGKRKAKLAVIKEPIRKPWNLKTKEETPATDKKGKAMPVCACGCGGHTKGGRFQPGHDARFYAKLRKEAMARGEDPRMVQHG